MQLTVFIFRSCDFVNVTKPLCNHNETDCLTVKTESLLNYGENKDDYIDSIVVKTDCYACSLSVSRF